MLDFGSINTGFGFDPQLVWRKLAHSEAPDPPRHSWTRRTGSGLIPHNRFFVQTRFAAQSKRRSRFLTAIGVVFVRL